MSTNVTTSWSEKCNFIRIRLGVRPRHICLSSYENGTRDSCMIKLVSRSSSAARYLFIPSLRLVLHSFAVCMVLICPGIHGCVDDRVGLPGGFPNGLGQHCHPRAQEAS